MRGKEELAQQAAQRYRELFQSIDQGFCTITVKYDEAELILLVDDNRNALLIMERILQLKGYSVQACHSGEEALEAAERWRPAVVILGQTDALNRVVGLR